MNKKTDAPLTGMSNAGRPPERGGPGPAREAGGVRGALANLESVRAAISAAARASGREPSTVRLVAISKTCGAEQIMPVLDAGQRIFGENRVQEAESKWPAFKARFQDVELHLVGALQSNKAAQAVSLFDVIESVDRPKLARALAEAAAKAGGCPRCFIQVNTGGEAQKAGVSPPEADALIRSVREDYKLPLVGLMCVPPVFEEPSLHFALLREIAWRNDLKELSMGMSGDFETAIRFGATYVRIGTAIFGQREKA